MKFKGIHSDINACEISEKYVGKLSKPRHNYAYQVWQGKIIITGGVITNGDLLRSTEIIDCSGGEQGD
jgi:hypothetical protein